MVITLSLITAIVRNRFRLNQGDVVLKGHRTIVEPLEREILEHSVILQDHQALLDRIHPQHNRLTMQLAADVIPLATNLDGAVLPRKYVS